MPASTASPSLANASPIHRQSIAEFEQHLSRCRSRSSRTGMVKAPSARIRKSAGQERPAQLENRVRRHSGTF